MKKQLVVCLFGLVALGAVSRGECAEKNSKSWVKLVPQLAASDRQAKSTGESKFQPTKSIPRILAPEVIGGINAEGKYPNVGPVLGYKGNVYVNGTGTLIANRWMLTAAHVVKSCIQNGGSIGFHVGNVTYWADGYIIHPNYGRMSPGLAFEPGGLPYGDIALVRLSRHVPTAIKPALIQTVPGRVGQVLTIVGYGDTGTGQTGSQRGSNGTKRVGTQVVEAVGSDWLLWSFDRNERYSTAHGDSGGPQFNSSGAIVSITTGGNVRGAGGNGTGWGCICWNTRCDIHFNWMRDMISRFSGSSTAPAAVRYMVEPERALGDTLDLLPSSSRLGINPKVLLSDRSVE